MTVLDQGDRSMTVVGSAAHDANGLTVEGDDAPALRPVGPVIW